MKRFINKTNKFTDRSLIVVARRSSFDKNCFDHIPNFLLEINVNESVPRQPCPVENTEPQPKCTAHPSVADLIAKKHDVGKYREYHKGYDE